MKIKEKSFIELDRAKEKKKTTVGSTPNQRLKDDSIRDAWLELKGNPPWTTKRFLCELTSYEDDSVINEIISSKL